MRERIREPLTSIVRSQGKVEALGWRLILFSCEGAIRFTRCPVADGFEIRSRFILGES